MKIKLAYISCMVLLLTGCNGFLDVVPKDKQTEAQLFSSKVGFYNAANGIYNNIATDSLYGRCLSYELIEFLGRRYIYGSEQNQYYYALINADYTDQSVEHALSSIWRRAYKTIFNCNVVIKNIDDQTGVMPVEEGAIMKGEMLAVRAFLHFDMLRLFGPFYSENPHAASIPYNDVSHVQVLPILSADSILKYRVLRDLDEAERLLKDTDPVISGGRLASAATDGEDPHLRYRQLRFNYYAVKALKARVYLYAQDKANALREAKELLLDPKFQEFFPPVDPSTLLANTTNPDRVFSTEVIMGIYRKDRDDIYTNTYDYSTAGDQNFLQPRDYLSSEIFQQTWDYRFQSQWQNTSANAGHDLIKFKEISQPTDGSGPYFFSTLMSLLRVSELYYIAAESEPVLADGYAWLNQIRQRRGLAALEQVSEDDLMEIIRKEYIREFAGEGQVFFLYKRLKADMPASENGNRAEVYPATTAAYIMPLPKNEVDNR